MMTRPETILQPEILVLGTGAAALSAALAAARAGADTALAGDLTGPAWLRRRAAAAGVALLQATVWGVFPGLEVAAFGADMRLVLRPRRLVLVPEMHEVPVPLPGWTLPGCMDGSTLAAALSAGEPVAGPVVLAGDGPLILAWAQALLRRRVAVAGLALASPTARIPAALRRVPVWFGTSWVEAEAAAGRLVALHVTGPAGQFRIPAQSAVLHWGLQAETAFARALGAQHDVQDGCLRTVLDAQGRTSMPGLFVVAPGPDARRRGITTGRAAAGPLQPPGPAMAPSRLLLPAPRKLPGGTVMCRCEAVTAGMIDAAIAAGNLSAGAIKRATRAGMGLCGGRACTAAIARLCGAADEARFPSPRMPQRPVKAADILADRPEPVDAAIALPPPPRWLGAAPAALPADADILVVGGGIVGLACALFLAREGRDVLLADRGEPGGAASTANAGSLHIQLVPYVYQPGDGGPMADALPLGPTSVALWREIARDANEDLGLRTEGGLVLAETEADLVRLRSKAAFERSRGVPTEVIGPVDLARMAPALGGPFAGAAFCPMEGQGDPLRGTAALRALALRAGVRIVPGLDVTGLDVTGLCADKGGWRVQTSAGTLRAGQVVNAAGAQARRVAALAGVTLPCVALVQQVIVTESVAPILRQLVAWTGRHLSLKQGAGGHLLIGGGWPGTVDAAGATHLLRTSLEGNLALAARALPPLRTARVTRAWTGLAPHLARAPLISGTPGLPGLWHAVSGNGYTLGPVMGRMVADAVLARTPLPAAFAL